MSPEDIVNDTAGIKTSVTEIDAAHRSISVEVPAEMVAAEFEKACRLYSRSLKVPGFRKGKVPLPIIKQRFGREIEQETVERAIQEAIRKVIAEVRPRPLRPPVLTEYNHEQGRPLTFKATYEVLPRVKVAGVDSIRVKPAEPEVTDQMIAEALESLRERAARFEPVEDRGVAPGDHVVMDARADDAAGKGRAFQRENFLTEIGSGGPHPELSDPMRGMKPGETREFTIVYPADHPDPGMAGRKLAYTVTVREIKRKVLPDLDDEFARDLGKFETLEELRNKIAGDLMKRERRRVREESRREVIDQLLSLNPDVAVPDVLVEEELDRRVDEVARSLAMQGLDPRLHSVDWDEIRRKQRDPAVREVRATILLDAIAEEQKISIEPEMLDRAIAAEAERRRQTPEALRAQLAKDGRLEKLSEHLRREKVLDFLLNASNT